jgi:hypothetical protein
MKPKYIDDFLYTTQAHADLAAANSLNHPAPDCQKAWREIADALYQAAARIRAVQPRKPSQAA